MAEGAAKSNLGNGRSNRCPRNTLERELVFNRECAPINANQKWELDHGFRGWYGCDGGSGSGSSARSRARELLRIEAGHWRNHLLSSRLNQG